MCWLPIGRSALSIVTGAIAVLGSGVVEAQKPERPRKGLLLGGALGAGAARAAGFHVECDVSFRVGWTLSSDTALVLAVTVFDNDQIATETEIDDESSTSFVAGARHALRGGTWIEVAVGGAWISEPIAEPFLSLESNHAIRHRGVALFGAYGYDHPLRGSLFATAEIHATYAMYGGTGDVGIIALAVGFTWY